MKTNTFSKKLSCAILCFCVCVFSFISLPANAETASVITHPSADITLNSAVVSGELSNLGAKDSANVWFEYGLTTTYGSKTNSQTMNRIGTFQATLSNLQSCTLYHYRAAADNGNGVVYGIDRTFTTFCSSNDFSISLEAIPYSGPAPLNNVDLKVTVAGKEAGDVRYWLDCENNGSWEKQVSVYQGPSGSYTADNLCNYPTAGVYTAKARAERLGLSAEATAVITVGQANQPTPSPSGQYTLSVQKTVQNITKGTGFEDAVAADFGDEIIYKIVIVSSGQVSAPAVYVKDVLPSGLIYLGNVTVDGISNNQNILEGFLLGDIPSGVTKTITYRAKVREKEFFNFGTNNLINSVLVYNTGLAISDTAKVVVAKSAVAGAATEVNTGFMNSIFQSLLLPLGLAGLLLFIFKSPLIGFDRWLVLRKNEIDDFRAKSRFQSLIKKRK